MAKINDPAEIEEALRTATVVAVVGCSPDPGRAASSISRYLLRSGYRVIPVNPRYPEVLGLPSYPDLISIPADVRVDIVDVFRRSDAVSAIADQAIQRGVGFFWMQDDVIDRVSAERLVSAGIPVAMGRCIFRDRQAIL